MNRRVQLILFSAFMIAALCSYAVYRVVGARLASSQPKTTRVVVAAADIPLGSVLHAENLGTAEISGPLPKGVLVDLPQAVGRGVISNIYQGEPIMESRLAAPGAGGGLAATIRPGMRACAIRVDEVVGVAGFVTPGMHVDVLISGVPPGAAAVASEQGPKVRTLLQDIEVLSAGTDIQRDQDGKPQQVQVVNLLVTPDQAEQLSLASNQTKIQLVLRNPLDRVIAEPPGTAMAALFTDKNAAPAPKPHQAIATVPHAAPPLPRTILVQVYNGSKRSDQKFVDGEEKQ
jgi:pilus assembly protein CpaB